MDSGPVVVDISSDEEDFSLDKPLDESYDWINQFLDDKEIEDFDDIMVVDQFFTSVEIQKENSGSLRPKNGALRDDSDDDCLILDGDPDKPVEVSDDKRDGGDGSDDLLILGEKGQIACRDFPHSRHLCANFPFSTTSHEKHCNLCHCYVCDSPAPCIYWGNGVSLADHCHATEKNEVWKAQRTSFKKRNTTTLPPQKLPDTMPPLIPPPVRNSEPICRPNPVSLPTEPSKSYPLHPCSATSIDIPYAPTQRHQQQPAIISYHGQRDNQHPTKSQPPIPRTQCVQRERHGGGALARSIVQSHSKCKYKRVGTTGSGLISSSTNRSQYRVFSPNQMHRSVPQKPQYPPAASERSQHQTVTSHRTQCTPVTSSEDGMRKWQDILSGVVSELRVSDSISSSTVAVQPYTVSSQPSDIGIQILSQMNSSQDMGLYPRSGPGSIPSNPLEDDCSWLDSTTGQNFSERGQEGNPQLAIVQPSDQVVSRDNPVAGEINFESILAAVEQETAPLAGTELGLPEMVPPSLLYDFEGTWSGLALV